MHVGHNCINTFENFYPSVRLSEMFGLGSYGPTSADVVDLVIEAASGSTPNRHLLSYAVVDNVVEKRFTSAGLLVQTREQFDDLECSSFTRSHIIPILGRAISTEMLPMFCQAASQRDLSVFLFGGRPGVVDGAARNMLDEFPDLSIAGTQHGCFAPSQEHTVIETINRARADILLVCSAELSERDWIFANRDELNGKVIVGAQRLFDNFYGKIWRRPAVMLQ